MQLSLQTKNTKEVFDMKKKNIKLCLVASQGGHIEELWQLHMLREKYDYYLVVPKTAWTEKLAGHKVFIKDMNRKNKITKALSLIFMFLEQLPILLKNPADVVVTTGAAVAIPICIYAKLFGKKIIYIESMARINSPSATGKLVYKFADLFIIQWEELRKFYPKAVYGGVIY